MERAIKRINIPLDPDLHRRMKTVAANLGIQIKDFVAGAIRLAIKEALAEKAVRPEDVAWLDGGGQDLLEMLTELEKDVPPKALEKYLRSFEKNSVPLRWNPRTERFEEIHDS